MNKINVVRPSMPPIEEYVEEIKSIWENRWLTHTGPKHQELERALPAWLGAKCVSLFCNGHASKRDLWDRLLDECREYLCMEISYFFHFWHAAHLYFELYRHFLLLTVQKT